MYIVEIESETSPGTWYQVDEPHAQYGEAVMKAFRLGVNFAYVIEHLRVRGPGRIILGA